VAVNVLLDTSLVIDLLRGTKRGIALMEALDRDGATFHLPSPVLYELSVGFAKHGARTQQALFEGMASHWHESRFGDRQARAAGEVQADLIALGAAASDVDAQIAGTALADRMVLASLDADHRRIAQATGIGFRDK
jgi:predicted nucleic acid-binding protein